MSAPVVPTLLGNVDKMTGAEVTQRFQEIVAAADWDTASQAFDVTFANLVREAYQAPRLFTYVDLFCGAGGSSIGLTMAGGKLLLAANHSKRAIETHSRNFSDAEHACVDIDHYDMRKIPPGAHVLWASPICTEVSPAGGNKADVGNPDQGELLKYGPVAAETFERTRATFHDVIRAAEVWQFPYVIVENVPEVAMKWRLFGWWLDGMEMINYGYQILCVDAAHVGGELNPHAAQHRNRMYIVFHRKDMAKPDVEPRPLSLCDTCGPVSGMQVWKKPDGVMTPSGRKMRIGKYGIKYGQYVYRCPNMVCRHSIVTPLERPATSIIDWSDLGTRIGDRKANGERELAASTLQRIARGIRLFGRPEHAPVNRNTLITPETAFLDANGGNWNTKPASVNLPFRTRTTSDWEGLVSAGSNPLIDTWRNHATPKPTSEPLSGLTAGGNHHGLVVPYYRTGKASPATRAPLPTLTTKDRCGLATSADAVAPLEDVMNAHYRMVNKKEASKAQRFPISYEITGNDGEVGAQIGNAVCTSVAQMLGERVAAALNRTAASAGRSQF